MTKAAKNALLLIAALEKWKCGACGGVGTYLHRGATVTGALSVTGSGRVKVGEIIPCKICGGSGQHPIARDALAAWRDAS